LCKAVEANYPGKAVDSQNVFHANSRTAFRTIESRGIAKVNQCTSILQIPLDAMNEATYIDLSI
jgi:hypothetical protein